MTWSQISILYLNLYWNGKGQTTTQRKTLHTVKALLCLFWRRSAFCRIMELMRDHAFSAADSALTSSILDHFESMQLNIQEEDKWGVSALMRYMLLWPAAPPIRTVILGQSPYPSAAGIPFYGSPFAYTSEEAPPSVVVLANTVSTCSAINNIQGLDWQTCEELFKHSDTLLQHGIVLANARSCTKFEDDKAARECATLVACLVHLLRRPVENPAEPIDMICLGVEAQRVSTLVTKIWGPEKSRRPINVAKCSHPAHLARKERKMYRYCIRLDDPTATRMLTEAVVAVVAERNNLEVATVAQPNDSRYIKRQSSSPGSSMAQGPSTPPEQNPSSRSESLGVGDWKPKTSSEAQSQNANYARVGSSGGRSIESNGHSGGLRTSKSSPISPNSEGVPARHSPSPPASLSRRTSEPEQQALGRRSNSSLLERRSIHTLNRAEQHGLPKSISPNQAEDQNSGRSGRIMSMTLHGGDQAGNFSLQLPSLQSHMPIACFPFSLLGLCCGY